MIIKEIYFLIKKKNHQTSLYVHNQTGLKDIDEPNSIYSLGDEIKPLFFNGSEFLFYLGSLKGEKFSNLQLQGWHNWMGTAIPEVEFILTN